MLVLSLDKQRDWLIDWLIAILNQKNASDLSIDDVIHQTADTGDVICHCVTQQLWFVLLICVLGHVTFISWTASLMVRMAACQAVDPSSILGRFTRFFAQNFVVVPVFFAGQPYSHQSHWSRSWLIMIESIHLQV